MYATVPRTRPTRGNSDTRRRGVTLLELLVVVSLMGILSTVVVSRYGRQLFGDFGARGDAHKLWMDLQLTRRLSIRTGRNHQLQFDGSAGRWTGYRIVEVNGVAARSELPARTFTPDIHVTCPARAVEFTFEGSSTASTVVQLKGPNRQWRVETGALSGLVTVTEI